MWPSPNPLLRSCNWTSSSFNELLALMKVPGGLDIPLDPRPEGTRCYSGARLVSHFGAGSGTVEPRDEDSDPKRRTLSFGVSERSGGKLDAADLA